MTQTITLDDGAARVVVRADLGAGLARYELRDGTPLFRPAPENATDPFVLANILLLPWSNRIGAGGFAFEGEHYALARNVAGEASPLHGSGFQQAWQVTHASATRAELELECDVPAPFRYTARASYELADGALTVTLAVANAAARALPYGLGVHPWLPRTRHTTLLLPASAAWLEDDAHLPTARVPIAARPDWDFSAQRPLPAGWINNAFAGWPGHASIVWPERDLALDIAAGPNLSTCIVFSPGQDSDFVCVEPVTHLPNAHNLPGGPEANGLTVLLTDEELAVACRFSPRRL